jgi:hypothetical protein
MPRHYRVWLCLGDRLRIREALLRQIQIVRVGDEALAEKTLVMAG